MKKISIAIMMLIAGLATMAQDNKPAPGSFGVGYGVSFFPTVQHINFTYVLANSLEVGGTVGFQYNRSRSSTFDSINVEGINFTELPAVRETKTVTTSASFFITPLVKYHFKTKNNLDIYVGGNIPIGVTTAPKQVVSEITTADNYNATGTVATTSPITVTVGAGVLLGCQYFFYQNLALGAEANLGFSASIANGNNVIQTSGSNSGSNNPDVAIVIPTVTTMRQVKNDSEGVGMLHSFGLSLSWYFGGKSK